jgi:hypothetical protein
MTPRRPAGEPDTCDAEETIGDGPEGASVRMTACSEGHVSAATASVMLVATRAQFADSAGA